MTSEFVKELSSIKSLKSRTPATKEEITYAESVLQLTFSKEYTEYLTAYGCASVFGHEFTGICKTERLNVMPVTLYQREQNHNIPNDWYVIEEANIDGITVWQTHSGEIYAIYPNHMPSKIADSFREYINKIL